MSNLLTPLGLVLRHLYDHRSQRVVPDARVDPMPCYIGAWIQTEKGVRRLMPKETSKGLGAPKAERPALTASILPSTTSLFHWEYLSSSLTLPSSGDSETKATKPLTEDEWSDNEDRPLWRR
jgi:hypothetical protein